MTRALLFLLWLARFVCAMFFVAGGTLLQVEAGAAWCWSAIAAWSLGAVIMPPAKGRGF